MAPRIYHGDTILPVLSSTEITITDLSTIAESHLSLKIAFGLIGLIITSTILSIYFSYIRDSGQADAEAAKDTTIEAEQDDSIDYEMYETARSTQRKHNHNGNAKCDDASEDSTVSTSATTSTEVSILSTSGSSTDTSTE